MICSLGMSNFLEEIPSLSHSVVSLYFFALFTKQVSLVAHMVKNLSAMRETQVWFLGWEDPLEKEMATPAFLPRKSHGQRNLLGYSLWGHKESDTTEWLILSLSLSLSLAYMRRPCQYIPVFLHGECLAIYSSILAWRSLVGYSP